MNHLSFLKLFTLSVLSLFFTTMLFAETDEFVVAHGVYPGNIGYFLMQAKLKKGESTFLEKRMRETGGKVKIVVIKDYAAALQGLASGQYDSFSIAAMDSLLTCADKGVDLVFVTITDYSNGTDAIIVPKGWTLENMKGKTIIGNQLCYMELLYRRWMDVTGKPKDYLKFKDTPGEQAPKIFLSALGTKNEVACLTWHPNVARLLETDKVEVAFSTASIPGESINGLGVRTECLERKKKSIQAFILAYYDAMAYYENPKTREHALRAVLSDMGFSQEELPLLQKMMKDEFLFTKKEDAIRFAKSKQFQRSKEIALDFFKESGALKSKNPDALDVKVDTRFLE